MNEILTKLFDKGVEMARDTQITDRLGREYIINGYNRIQEPTLPGFKTTSLVSIVDYIKQKFDRAAAVPGFEHPQFVIHVKSHELVVLTSSVVGVDLEREKYIASEAEYPSFNFGRFTDQEEFMIALLSKFKESEGRDYVLRIASGIVEGDEVKTIDNGMSQEITMRQSVGSLVDKEEMIPFVNLVPYRTFLEIEQPASIFLLRTRKGGLISLFEADGGKWKIDAKKNIVKFFKENLEDDMYKILY